MSFLEAVNEKYGELSPVQKRIADYMYKYPDEACFYSLREMANALGVTEVTVLRFARKLGFDSYVDMKKGSAGPSPGQTPGKRDSEVCQRPQRDGNQGAGS